MVTAFPRRHKSGEASPECMLTITAQETQTPHIALTQGDRRVEVIARDIAARKIQDQEYEADGDCV